MLSDSVAQTATLTSLALFLSSGLGPCSTGGVSAAPGYGMRATYSSSSSGGYYNMEPWLQPCGTPVAAALRKFPQRHSVHRALKRVKTQLRVAQNHFRKDLKDIHEIYSKVRYIQLCPLS